MPMSLAFAAAPAAAAAVVASRARPVVATATGQLVDRLKTADAIRRYAPNTLTLVGYAFGLWWSVGGPTWAGLASIALDEIDGRLARALNATSDLGSQLDYGVDVALTPMALLRLGRSTGLGAVPLLAAPPIVLHQARMRAEGDRPTIGSYRAGIMLLAMGAEVLGSLRRAPTAAESVRARRPSSSRGGA